MKNQTARIVIFFSVLALLLTIYVVYEVRKLEVAEIERIGQEEKNALRIAYIQQRHAFHLKDNNGTGDDVYLPFESIIGSNDNSSYNRIYCDLAYYERQTGIQLTMDEVREYLSQEYENDGTVRIFTNGRHPKIEEFVLWAWDKQNSAAMETHRGAVQVKCLDYTLAHPEIEWPDWALYEMPLQWVQEGIKKAADSDYEMWLDPDAKPMTREEMLA